jgi:hypothetical protein
LFSLVGDAFRDKYYMEWLLAKKGAEETTIDDF